MSQKLALIKNIAELTKAAAAFLESESRMDYNRLAFEAHMFFDFTNTQLKGKEDADYLQNERPEGANSIAEKVAA